MREKVMPSSVRHPCPPSLTTPASDLACTSGYECRHEMFRLCRLPPRAHACTPSLYILGVWAPLVLRLLMGETLQSGHTGGIPPLSLALLSPWIPALSLYRCHGDSMG